ncbi:UvrD-helicase domain-containing protein, partial [uncultured Corynebacterium sp.]|uniref:UvrD-helicase domain-containing protein n=1 Tax=uncultured Corynebacterium sp. TaxID=159447 RepID=UPI0025978C8C
MPKQDFSPEQIAKALGKDYPPTEEQAHVIEGPFGPKLVVAGAGAGKTETMASRVVYLVANGYVRPEAVLGLTFTRKAAQQLEQRIRRQLIQLRDSGLIVPGSPAAEALTNIAPTVATYDSYAGELVREYGLLVPVEPSARIITEAERFAIAYDVVKNYGGK